MFTVTCWTYWLPCFTSHCLTCVPWDHLPNKLLVLLYLLCSMSYLYALLFKKIYLFLERGEGREKYRERNNYAQKIHQSIASHAPPPGDLACSPGKCPDWESNQQSFDSQTGTQSTEPHQPRLENTLYSHIS